MEGGYVLDFSNQTFAQFFTEELNVDIDDPIYELGGSSKAKRLRYFLNKVDLATSIKTLNALWEYREAVRNDTKQAEWVENAEGKFLSLLRRMQGKPDNNSAGQPPKPALDKHKLYALKQQLVDLSSLEPQARGYAFETWLKELFNTYGLQAQNPFRLIGEQIDGSFVLQGETYLVEAKWHSALTSAADLHIFHGKIEQKAAWTRGLFVSNSGFTEDGLEAFGRGKRVICMDGLDLYDAIEREIPLTDVLERKVRRAAETGNPFCRVRDLFF
jgi:hypothetical protein